MFNFFKKKSFSEDELYNKILSFSRNKYFYKEIGLRDTFQIRIILIFFHVSFLLIKLKSNNDNVETNQFSQKIFDHVFKKIEENMREFGYGDGRVNKNMKDIVKIFYNILLKCENYHKLQNKNKITLLGNYLYLNNNVKKPNIMELIKYFDRYQTFCCELSINSVIKGYLNFKY